MKKVLVVAMFMSVLSVASISKAAETTLVCKAAESSNATSAVERARKYVVEAVKALLDAKAINLTGEVSAPSVSLTVDKDGYYTAALCVTVTVK